MKKLLLLLSILFLFSCSRSSDDSNIDNPSNPQGSGIGKATFTYAGKTYNYINYNYKDGGTIPVESINMEKPSLFWQTNSATSNQMQFNSGYYNGQASNENTIVLQIITNYIGTIPFMVINKGNGISTDVIICKNPKITYTTNNLNRISGTFTSDECKGSFSDIVRIN
jgi:hypothetical protein